MPTNILLDGNFTAKVADFGASRLVPLDKTRLTTLVQGTLGYLDPEYFHSSQLSEKSDVYSFGVVLAELITGKTALSFARPEKERNLATYFISSLEVNRLSQILDHQIENEINVGQVREVANLAQSCLMLKGNERPTMMEVAMELERLMRLKEHHRIGVEMNSDENEHLLGYSLDLGSGSTTARYGLQWWQDEGKRAMGNQQGQKERPYVSQTHLTTLVQGTYGYMDPEYFDSGNLTEKSDVYSFGVILIELLTGEKAFSLERPQKNRSLAKYFISSLEDDRLLQVLEDRAKSEGNVEQLGRVVELPKKCLKSRGEKRPTMEEVKNELVELSSFQMHSLAEI
ncbi:hypothetical protein F0562_027821 [Nyssa sinensis]|uniref:Protein kinase domain-containing protein n=1 Tax=Nyssa sinensis TaxID=561372 RepID=A0A5J5B7R3_9ASTE|nr:hypothetical protein F0562_027821 [Nyssa sinensis]